MAAAVKMPATPNACKSIPVRTDSRGGSGVPAAFAGAVPPDGGTNGDQLAAFTKKIPNPIKNSTTASLITVTVALNPELRRIPSTRITMRISAMRAASYRHGAGKLRVAERRQSAGHPRGHERERDRRTCEVCRRDPRKHEDTRPNYYADAEDHEVQGA